MASMYPLGGPRFLEGPKKVHSEFPGKSDGSPNRRDNALTGIEGDAISTRDIRPRPLALALQFSTLITSCMKRQSVNNDPTKTPGMEVRFTFAASTPNMFLPRFI